MLTYAVFQSVVVGTVPDIAVDEADDDMGFVVVVLTMAEDDDFGVVVVVLVMAEDDDFVVVFVV